MMRSVAAVFPVSSVRESVEWYTKTLGFAADQSPEKPTFAVLHRDGAEIMLREDAAVPRKHGRPFRWNAYIRLSGGAIESLYEEVRGKATIVRAPEQAAQGQTEFEVEDCNGYVLCFAESSES
jgi:catechol 2,3-dioxygenase-like lactoylglutathione lyase family enzyme